MFSVLLAHLQSRRWPPILLIAGIFWLAVFQGLHFGNVLGLTRNTPFDDSAKMMTVNITPLGWCAYLIFLLGLLALRDGRSWLWRHRFRFAVCWLWSVLAWCYFDWMNFYFMRDPATGLRTWEYINLPSRFDDRIAGYLVAFGAIAPGMFLTAETLQRLGFYKIKFNVAPPEEKAESQNHRAENHSAIENKKSKIRHVLPLAVLALGILLAPIPILVGTPASNLAIWVGTWALLDPINFWCRRPSIVGDWLEGRLGRTLALGAGGLICGFLWEFWNYWAATKWIYHLPFLGSWQQFKYFEMPVPGLIGFVAFGIETWTMWQTALLLLAPLVEGEQKTAADQALHTYGCF